MKREGGKYELVLYIFRELSTYNGEHTMSLPHTPLVNTSQSNELTGFCHE